MLTHLSTFVTLSNSNKPSLLSSAVVTGASGPNTFLGFLPSLLSHSFSLSLFTSFLYLSSLFLLNLPPALSLPSSENRLYRVRLMTISMRSCLIMICVYLGFFIGVPDKGEGIEGNLLYVANATGHFFVVRYKRKKNTFSILFSA